MQVVETQGRKSLFVGVWNKAEASQGATNCAAAQLTKDGAVLLGDTQNPNKVISLDLRAWTDLVRTAA